MTLHAFLIFALLLFCIGLYAVMSFSVGRRTSEVGIRMALGADRAKILALILRSGARPVGWGLLGGMALAVLLGRALATFLFDVSPMDPSTFVGIPVLLVVVSTAALLVPADRKYRCGMYWSPEIFRNWNAHSSSCVLSGR